MIDRDELVVNRIVEKVSDVPHKQVYFGGPGHIIRKNVFMVRYPEAESPVDFEVGVISNPKGLRGRLDLRNAAFYMTDHRARPVTHTIIESALGRLVQVSVGDIALAGFGHAPELLQPLTSIETPDGYNAVKDMYDMITGPLSTVRAPKPILSSLEPYPNSFTNAITA